MQVIAEKFYILSMSAPKRFERFNQYRNMWVLVFFDLPTETRAERKLASMFRKKLLDDGFSMFQFSIYMRFCASMENAQVHTQRVKKLLPKYGKVGILKVTDKQFALMELFHGTKKVLQEPISYQLEFF